MSLRFRVLGAVLLPAVVVLALSGLAIGVFTRQDRLADLDATLSAKASALAALVEHDEDGWEVDDTTSGATALLATLTGARVTSADGTLLLEHGEMTGRMLSRTLTAATEEGDAEGAAIVVDVAQDTAAIDASSLRLAQVIAVTGLALTALAAALASWLSARIVDGEAHRRLQERFAAITRFTADASHELRTPLAGIRLEAEIAMRKDRAPAFYQDALAGILERANAMQSLIEGLLSLARADAGLEPEWSKVDLREIALRAANGVPVEGPALPVRGDMGQLTMAVDNLVANARRHTPSGDIRVALLREGPWAVLEVIDRGEGIPAEALPRVFERFFRVDEARTREAGGSGLGLSIVEGIVRQHGGDATIRSVLGEGTTVRIRLPVVEDPRGPR